ncbi:hypothetical protein AMR41_05895 [Hapalosiphon sp. MRB220]|nr:hypothetical protein AMR41_05895 [Hapalosiphon sp. MRB220]
MCDFMKRDSKNKDLQKQKPFYLIFPLTLVLFTSDCSRNINVSKEILIIIKKELKLTKTMSTSIKVRQVMYFK